MPIFEIIGLDRYGKQVMERIEANSEELALSTIKQKHDQLRKGYQIVKVISLSPLDDVPVDPSKNYKYNIVSEDEIISLAKKIMNNEVTQEEFTLFRSILKNVIRNALNILWNDQMICTKEELENELIYAIASEFISSYKANLGAFWYSIPKKIKNRIIKKFSRENYVNPENKKKRRSKHDAQREYVRLQSIPKNFPDREQRLQNVIKAAKAWKEEKDFKPSLPFRREFFGSVVQLGLHKALLTFPRQIEALDKVYGRNPYLEIQVAAERGTSQSTINITKRRAEKNLLTKIQENF